MPIALSPPAEEPVPLGAVKAHLRVEHDAEDALIAVYLAAARDHVERETGRTLIDRRLRATFDAFPVSGPASGFRAPLRLPRPPVLGLLEIAYLAPDGTATVLPLDSVAWDPVAEPVRLWPAPGTAWPATAARPGAVRVDYRAGLPAAADLPGSLVAAVLLLTGHLYERREPVSSGAAAEMPFGVTALLAPYKVWTL